MKKYLRHFINCIRGLCKLHLAKQQSLCNVLTKKIIKDKAGGNGLLRLHNVVSRLINPGRMSFILTFKSREK